MRLVHTGRGLAPSGVAESRIMPASCARQWRPRVGPPPVLAGSDRERGRVAPRMTTGLIRDARFRLLSRPRLCVVAVCVDDARAVCCSRARPAGRQQSAGSLRSEARWIADRDRRRVLRLHGCIVLFRATRPDIGGLVSPVDHPREAGPLSNEPSHHYGHHEDSGSRGSRGRQIPVGEQACNVDDVAQVRALAASVGRRDGGADGSQGGCNG
jgi:hypothetical protein